MNDDNDDIVYHGLQNTIDGYLGAIEFSDEETRKDHLKQVMFLAQDWDNYCAKAGMVGRPLSFKLRVDSNAPIAQPKPEPVRNHRREAILAQRARKTA